MRSFVIALIACPICGTGGFDTTFVLGIFFGLCSLGFLLLFFWFIATKQFHDTNQLNNAPLEAERWAKGQSYEK